MGLQLVQGPAVEPVTLADAKAHLRVEIPDDDVLILALITAARQIAENHTGRAFVTQTWDYVLDFSPNVIRVPKAPLQSVQSITVIDFDGTQKIVDPTTYLVDTSGAVPRITPKATATMSAIRPDFWHGVWPWHRGWASFIIRFTAGYGADGTAVPEAIKQAIKQIVGHLYENRESQEMPAGAKALLAPYRVNLL